MNDAPRRWWNRIDGSLKYGMVPTRADRCVYVLYGPDRTTPKGEASQLEKSNVLPHDYSKRVEQYMEKLLDPITGSPSEGRSALGVICLHVDDLFMTGSKEFYDYIGTSSARSTK